MKKNLGQFEETFGKSRVDELEKALKHAQPRRALTVDIPSEKNTIQFAVLGDMHVGSIYCCYDGYDAFMRRVKAEGINTVLCTGDLLDGHKVYPGHEYEVNALGYAEQCKRFVTMTPHIPGVTTYFITGNHDHSLKKLAGVDVGNDLAEKRPDFVFLGEDYGEMVLKTNDERKYGVRLVHPDGGTAYAVSYKAQKLAESIEGGTKPNMLLIGHFHKAEHLPSYRNIDIIQSGCFQWQTPYLVRKGSPAHVGGWIVRVTVGDKRSMSNAVRAEFVAYYNRGN